MLHSDQDRRPRAQGAYGFAGSTDTHSESIHELAREIEETQRRQGETIAHIVERLRALDLQRVAESLAPQMAAGAASRASDEPWDASSAEALMQTYEVEGVARSASHLSASGGQQEWLGHRFQDVTERIKRTLSDLKPGSTMRLLEDRLDQFQKHISSALEDVVRRSDLDGLKLIETHINYLGDKLDELERHVSRIDGIEADVRSVMDQVSDERIAKLLDYDTRFAADLEAVAVRAAEEVHARLGQDDERARADAKRHDELRALIETSIHDRRKAEVDAATLVGGLSGRVNAQSDRYDELKGLLETAIQEQRQNEQTAFGMLDTLQQAMVRILDRMDAVEQQQKPVPAWTVDDSAPMFNEPEDGHYQHAFGQHAFGGEPAPAEPASAEGRLDLASVTEPAFPAPLDTPSELSADLADEAPASQDEGGSPVDRLRRDFIADARRAKMKAAANRAEASVEKAEASKRAMIETVRAPMAETAPQPSAGSGRLFGASPKLLAGVLALIVAINGGILLINRKDASRIAAPEITISPSGSISADSNGSDASGSEGGAQPETTPPGPRSELDLDADPSGFAKFIPPAPKDFENTGSADSRTASPFGYGDDVLDPPAIETLGENVAPSIPGGMTIAKPAGSMPDDVVADIYQQQILASLSGKLGTTAAGHTPDALLPEKSGRIDTSFTPPDATIESGDIAGRSSALDLPPVTVGPLSLRLAAANGDASAEFEVAARLAEGKGTRQDFADALRWYQRSATKGFAQAQYRLGTLYERGLGVTKDLGRARIWYSRAAEQGNVKSMHNLAVLAAGGESAEPDYATANQWFVKAAEHGLADSQYNLGVLLENGLGVKADRVSAYKWYALAAKSGDTDALSRRDALKGALTAEDLKTGDNQIAAFKARALIPLANDARAAGEDWKKRVNNDTNG